MSLKKEIEKEMFTESLDDRMQDIASLIDSSVEDVQKRMKTLSFSDYIEVMSALKSKDASAIKNTMGLMESSNEEDCPACHGLGWDQSVTADEDERGCDECGGTGKIEEGWSELPAMPDKYQARDGLEGPIMTKSGKVVYYDPKEGSYYDPDTDIFLSYDEWKALDEAYSTGSQGPDPRGKDAYVGADTEEPVGTTSAQDAQAGQKLKTARTQAMQRLGRDNLGGATAAQTADAMDKAEQGKPLTPIQRQAMAYQAANLDGLSMSPETRIQFRNLLNRLRKAAEKEQ